MELETMGKVTVAVDIENVRDAIEAHAGRLAPVEIRKIRVGDALVDSGAKLVALPKSLIRQLGLEQIGTQRAKTSAGIVKCNIYSAVRLSINDRQCTVDVAEVPEECPVLIGYVPLELLDMVIDPVRGQLIPSPENGGQQVLDLF